MARYVAFLRALNVGGHTITNDDLRQLFADLGVEDPTPYQASGNVVFDTDETEPERLETRIEAHLAAALDYEVATFLRRIEEVVDLAEADSFPRSDPEGKVHVAFLRRPLDEAEHTDLADLANGADVFTIRDRHVLWQVAGRFSDSPLAGPRFARALGQPTTLRTQSTLVRIAARFGA